MVLSPGARPAWLEAATEVVRLRVAAESGRFALWQPVLMAAGVAGYFSLTIEPPWRRGGPGCPRLLARWRLAG
jgi:hypothetical protein